MTSDVEQLRAARRDSEAFRSFYRAHAEWLYRWLALQVQDPQVAADLTAESFAQALVSLPRFRGERPGTGTGWLFGIARNLLRRYLHDQRVETRARLRMSMPVRDYHPEEFEEVEHRLDAAAIAPQLAAALDALSPDLRRVLELRVVDELDYGELARIAGISEPHARVRASRAVRALAAKLAATTKEARR